MRRMASISALIRKQMYLPQPERDLKAIAMTKASAMPAMLACRGVIAVRRAAGPSGERRLLKVAHRTSVLHEGQENIYSMAGCLHWPVRQRTAERD